MCRDVSAATAVADFYKYIASAKVREQFKTACER